MLGGWSTLGGGEDVEAELFKVLNLILDHLLDERVEVDGEGQEDLQVGHGQRLPVKGEEGVQLLLVPVHLQEGFNLLLGWDHRAHLD